MTVVSPLATAPPLRHARAPWPERLDALLTRPMFLLALAFLVTSAGVLHRIDHGHTTLFEAEVIVWGLFLLWPVFIGEAVLRLVFCRGRTIAWWRRLLYTLLLAVAPPFRLCARSYADSGKVWLPWIGWHCVDKHVRRRLERFFSVPMIIIALMVLPVLAMDYIWEAQVREDFTLLLVHDIGTSIIWLAFALEFIIMVSVADKPLRYCVINWMDVAIVVLPIVDALPILRLFRLTRVLELQQLSRVGRVYRLRGLLLKLWRAVLVLEMIQRLFGNYKGRRLKRLRELLTAREEEILELRQEIVDLERVLQAESGTGAPPAAPTALPPAPTALPISAPPVTATPVPVASEQPLT